MKINKQLFEDVLSDKLKGTFVLRNKQEISSSELIRNNSFYSETHPYSLFGATYNPNGKTSLYDYEKLNDIINFIPDINMKENELTIEIPDNKVVDWEESKKQNKIVLKDKQLTYRDVCEKLFKNKEILYTGTCGDVKKATYSEVKDCIYDKNNASTEHQLECILAKNMLANTAKYLNDGWKPINSASVWIIEYARYLGYQAVSIQAGSTAFNCYGLVVFKSKELAQQAIEILGEETVKLALEPLGI